MRKNGLYIKYKNGINTLLFTNQNISYPAGAVLCHIFQGETLYNISRILLNCINHCPFGSNNLTPDEIEESERYILQALLYEDSLPAQVLAQGSFIRCMEEYRSLDSETSCRLLSQEKQRVLDNDILCNDIGFDTVGNFLRLCYNNYIIDLINGIELFSCTSAVWSKTSTDEEFQNFQDLCHSLNNNESIPGVVMKTSYDEFTGKFDHYYIINSFLAMAFFEFSHIEESKTKILRCQNPMCRKYFVAKRKSAKYCSFPSPQNDSRTCNDYYPQLIHREKIQSNELDRLIKNAKGRLYNAKRRHPNQKEEIDALLSDLAINAPNKKEDFFNNSLSLNDFREWLNSHKQEGFK